MNIDALKDNHQYAHYTLPSHHVVRSRMNLRVLTGLPGSGKSRALIREMQRRSSAGDEVVLCLSSEHVELTRRPNVRPGGVMGCRQPGLGYEIDHVVDTSQAIKILSRTNPGTLAVFDEAQFFQLGIVDAWLAAAKRGVDVLVASPSKPQLKKLTGLGYETENLEVECTCCVRKATQVTYGIEAAYPIHLCDQCFEDQMKQEIEQLLSDVREAEPFPGENHTYQPFFEIPMDGWKLVREDSPARFEIVSSAVHR